MITKQVIIALADAIRASASIEDPNDYEANTFAEGFVYGRHKQLNETINALADVCQSQNRRFDREKWLAYIAGKRGSRPLTNDKLGDNNND